LEHLAVVLFNAEKVKLGFVDEFLELLASLLLVMIQFNSSLLVGWVLEVWSEQLRVICLLLGVSILSRIELVLLFIDLCRDESLILGLEVEEDTLGDYLAQILEA
jgi:hypothetical protein